MEQYRSAQFRSEARMSNPENVFGIYYDTKCIFWVEARDTFPSFLPPNKNLPNRALANILFFNRNLIGPLDCLDQIQ